MLAKLTSKNQLTLPKSVTQPLGPVQYFEVHTQAGQIILTPVRIQRGDALRAKLAELDIDAKTIESALRWADKTIETPARKKTASAEKKPAAQKKMVAVKKSLAKPLSAAKSIATKNAAAKTRKAAAVKTTETAKAAPKPRSATRKQASSKPVSAQKVFARAKAVKR